MGAPATAVRSRPARTGSHRKSAAAPVRDRRRPTASPRTQRSRVTPPAGVAMLPVQAVGSAAGAIGGIADSGLVVGMTRGRAWIAVIGILLGGIVALNVLGLSLSASTSGASTQIDELERANSLLRAKVGAGGSGSRADALASSLGLKTPEGKDLRYIKAAGRDVAAAVALLDGLAISPVLSASASAEAAAGSEAAAAAPASTTGTETATGAESAAAEPVSAPAVEAVAPPAESTGAETTATPAAPEAAAEDGGLAP